MKKLILAVIALMAAAMAAKGADDTPWKYVDAQDLRIINKGFDDSPRLFSRLPAYLKDSVRPDLWSRAECSSGMAVHFATDSRRIGVRCQLLWNFHMNHMADAGIKGTDLYILDGDRWMHVNSARPTVKDVDGRKMTESTYVSNLDGEMHQFMVYLPLYDGVEDLQIKVDSTATIVPGDVSLMPSTGRIVAYGTSIMQGGCASRTGMTSSNIISRELGRQVINLGFSGEGKQDPAVARAINRIPGVDLYLLDPVPNNTEKMCDTLTYDFVKIIADANPGKPIVMVAGLLYPYAKYDSYFNKYLPAKNDAYRRNFQRLRDEGYNVYFIEPEGMTGAEDEGTVDGVHLTDLGFVKYCELVLPVLRRILDEQPI